MTEFPEGVALYCYSVYSEELLMFDIKHQTCRRLGTSKRGGRSASSMSNMLFPGTNRSQVVALGTSLKQRKV